MADEGSADAYRPHLDIDGQIFFNIYDVCARKLYPHVLENGYFSALKTCVQAQMGLMRDFAEQAVLPSFNLASIAAERKGGQEEDDNEEDD